MNSNQIYFGCGCTVGVHKYMSICFVLLRILAQNIFVYTLQAESELTKGVEVWSMKALALFVNLSCAFICKAAGMDLQSEPPSAVHIINYHNTRYHRLCNTFICLMH